MYSLDIKKFNYYYTTELGECSKQRVAQGVLLQLLRATTQLDMVEFSYAMETLGTLTDALRLKQRVQLSIQRDNTGQQNILDVRSGKYVGCNFRMLC